MRLLYVIDSLAPGGAETSLADMTRGLMVGGIELHVLPLKGAGGVAPRIEADGGVVHAPPVRPGRLAAIKRVLQVIDEAQPALVHTTLYEADVCGRLAATIRRVPCSSSIVNVSYDLAHAREVNAVKLRAALIVDAATAHLSRRLHAITEVVAENASRNLRYSRQRIDVIPRGRDPRRYAFRDEGERERVRQELGVELDTPVVLTVGRHEPQKRQADLVAAMEFVWREYPRAELWLAGKDGRSTAELHDLAAPLGERVRFLGHRSDVPALLSAADVFAFPSEREGLGGVLIEAMAAGCPVVASAIPTSLEVLAEGRCGLLHPRADVPSLAAALVQSLGDGGADRVTQARRRFEEHFTIDVVSEAMARWFHTVGAA